MTRGYVFVHDRVKDMIVTGGENVYPRRGRECGLIAHPGIGDVAVIGVPDPKWGEAVKAIVVPRPRPNLTEATLSRSARERLAGLQAAEVR